ncbi:hypothetical protein BI001_gp044 [Bacillus phage Zuko]|uniref:hypothetical protein n=1 Tax=Bacillus phage Zuko TaxID=1805956 RepID=UPI0007A77138|nr:hypothetical protein BI001_gp044 [Bacillus phage Zuko]AMW62440.1 hypothetical protein ZUKO_44 [Bacillus phage Zuko]
MNKWCKWFGHKRGGVLPWKPTPLGISRGYAKEGVEVLFTVESHCPRCGDKITELKWFKLEEWENRYTYKTMGCEFLLKRDLD